MASYARTLYPEDLAPVSDSGPVVTVSQLFKRLDLLGVNYTVKHGLVCEEVTGYNCTVLVLEDGSGFTWDHEADGEPLVYQADLQWSDEIPLVRRWVDSTNQPSWLAMVGQPEEETEYPT